MEFFLIWLACAFVCAFGAGQKKRSAVGWFFAGFFFGPFAVAAVFLAQKKT